MNGCSTMHLTIFSLKYLRWLAANSQVGVENVLDILRGGVNTALLAM
jgi:hypothetical protein